MHSTRIRAFLKPYSTGAISQQRTLLVVALLVGAGAIVVRDLPANVVAVGNPARVIRTFEG